MTYREINPNANLKRLGHTPRVFLGALFAFIFIGILTALCFTHLKNTEATSFTFEAGNIISDAVMTDYNSMSESDIQNFLNSHGDCYSYPNHINGNTYTFAGYTFYDVGGGNLQRAGSNSYYHLTDGHFTCMAHEHFNGERGDIIGSGDSAAHIIYSAAQEFKINPQVLLVLFEKEKGLISDNFPSSSDYGWALGFGAYDFGDWESACAGFRRQVRLAASFYATITYGNPSLYIFPDFKGQPRYDTFQGWFNRSLGDHWIQYSPNGDCGGSTVYIQNYATLALYVYTPYQPNQAVLDTPPGTVVTCGAYGNYNFSYYFNNWFGDPRDLTSIPATRGEKLNSISDSLSYTINSAIDTTFAIDLDSGNADNGTNIQLWTLLKNNAQQWQFVYHSDVGFYEIINPATGKAFDVAGASRLRGTNVQIWERNQTCAQLWRITETADGYYDIQSSCSQLRLDVSGGIVANGTNIQLYSSNGTLAQKWRLQPINQSVATDTEYVIKSHINNSFVLDISGGVSFAGPGTNIQLWADNYTPAQRWRLEYQPATGFYRIANPATGLYVDIDNASNISGTNVKTWSANQSCAQLFQITQLQDNSYDIRSSCSNLHLDVTAGNIYLGNNIQAWTGNGSNAQKWDFLGVNELLDQNRTYTIGSAVNGYYVLDISGGAEGAAAGTNVHLWENNNTNAQKWQFARYGNTDLYEIINPTTGYRLDVHNASTLDGTNVKVWYGNQSCAQLWRITKDATGRYTFQSSCSNLVLDSYGGYAYSGNNVQIWSSNDTLAQKWWLTSI